jgi:hypothetical protein
LERRSSENLVANNFTIVEAAVVAEASEMMQLSEWELMSRISDKDFTASSLTALFVS